MLADKEKMIVLNEIDICSKCGEKVNWYISHNFICPNCGSNEELHYLQCMKLLRQNALEDVENRIAEIKRESGEIEEL